MTEVRPDSTTHNFVIRMLGSIALAEDGTRLFLKLVCENGEHVNLNLPIECLDNLIMTLPQIANKALQIRRGDEKLRLVYRASGVRFEQSADPAMIIATLATFDGFEVSLGFTRTQVADLGDAASEAYEKSAPENFARSN